MVRGNRLSLLCGVALLLGFCAVASARLVAGRSPEEFLREANVIVVGEVESITEGKRIREDRTWKIPVTMMRVRIRVLRSSPSHGPDTPSPGSAITFAYKVPTDGGDGRTPISAIALNAGDSYAFPLEIPRPNATDWRLIDSEDHNGILTPCLRPAPQEGLDDIDFLVHEHIGTLAYGDAQPLVRAAECLRKWRRPGDGRPYVRLLRQIHEGLRNRLDDRDDQWLDIAIAVYCSFGTPRPGTLNELLEGDEGPDGRGVLVAAALSHVEREGVHERMIERLVSELDLLSWGAAVTVRDNYPDHPLTTRLLRDALRQDRPGAVGLAEWSIRAANTVDGDWGPDLAASAAHPLHSAAEASACRSVVRRQGDMDEQQHYSTMRHATDFLRLHGSESAYALAVEALKDAVDDHEERFSALRRELIDERPPRPVEP